VNIHKLSVKYSFLIICVSLYACSSEESRPKYDPFKNTLVEGGETIKWNKNQGLVNIDNVEKMFYPKDKKIFSASLEWYATESNYSFNKLSEKTAKQTVDIINCLKSTDLNKQDNCF